MLSLTDEETGKSGGITLGSVDNKPVSCTAPPQFKELTDAEIEKVFWEIANKKVDNPVMEFARAILRKAQGE